jgi:exonuclease III
MNARSIVNKIKELKVMIEEENVDIISITETWLNDNVTDDEVSINGYTLFRKDRRDEVKCRGGGVAMYIKNELNPTFNSDLGNDSFSESIWCSIGFGIENTILGVCYRAPDSIESNDERLYNLLNRIKNCKIIVMGDFNFPELDWSNMDNLDVQNPFVDCLLNNFCFNLWMSRLGVKNI